MTNEFEKLLEEYLGKEEESNFKGVKSLRAPL